MEIFVLVLTGVLCFLTRLFSVIRNEPMIHEYDPYFNYKLTSILKEKGFYNFWNYFDKKSWFPLGRTTGQTLFPGLMMTSFLIYNICHMLGFMVDMRNICIYIGPIFSFFTCIISYLLTKEIYPFTGSALLASLFVSISPSHISRTVAGSYDNESISIFLLLLSEHFKLHEEKFKNIFVQVCFIFFALIFKFLIFTDKLSWNHRSRTLLDPTYASKHNPIVASISEHQPTTWSSYFFDVHLILLFLPCGLLLLIFSPFASILSAVGLSSLISRCVFFIRVPKDTYLSSVLVSEGGGSSRSGSSYRSKSSYINGSGGDNGSKIRCSSRGSSVDPCEGVSTMRNAYSEWRIESLKWEEGNERNLLRDAERISGEMKEICSNKKDIPSDKFLKNSSTFGDVKIRKLVFNRAEQNTVSMLTSICILILLIYFVILTILHSTWCSSIAYSESHITFYSRNKNGDRYINDDIRQMYEWINKNTEKDSKIVAWWDYGYQLNVMSDRITYVDNNTWNYTHIATVGLILSTNEKQAYEYLKKLNADYVLISYGGYSKNSSDDLNKFLWMLKITNKKYFFINPLLYYYHDEYHPLGKNATTCMTNSVLYKLSYYNMTNQYVKGYDYIRKIEVPEIKNLNYFEEVFTSDVWGFRLYKVREFV
ncbi:oligosacharyl transferase STT3 subunit [Plasmodium malariae]|uniref:dolichyl-diphosphooligosaccharide--protein glycotransferase n=1 Tax=Plasmodium malariae TaxID=5858 RepID=A0A1A8VXR0_PLAMA|nr:oligosacharyl transferase STT3 subunit [Plasmodium malariae]